MTIAAVWRRGLAWVLGCTVGLILMGTTASASQPQSTTITVTITPNQWIAVQNLLLSSHLDPSDAHATNELFDSMCPMGLPVPKLASQRHRAVTFRIGLTAKQLASDNRAIRTGHCGKIHTVQQDYRTAFAQWLVANKVSQSAVSNAVAGQQYLADVAPYNAAVDAYDYESTSIKTFAQQAAAAAPLLAVSQQFDSIILRQNWPIGVRQDVKNLVAADGLEEGDLTSLENANALNYTSVNAAFIRDNDASSQDANILRSDLGLPPPSL